MIICLCRGVSDRIVRLSVLQGARSVDEIGAACGAGDGCGSCHEELQNIAGEIGGHGCSAGLAVQDDCFAPPGRVGSRGVSVGGSADVISAHPGADRDPA